MSILISVFSLHGWDDIMTKSRAKFIEDLEPRMREVMQEALQEWFDAVIEFDQWKDRLYSVTAAYSSAPTHGVSARNTFVATSLQKLYSELITSFKVLLIDISSMDDSKDHSWQKLRAHAVTINQWSNRIKVALSDHDSRIA